MKDSQSPTKSTSISRYKSGMIFKWFQKVPSFHGGGLRGIFNLALPWPSPQAVLQPKRKQPQGYTLIEILLAITVLAFGLTAVATMQVTAIRANGFARNMSQGLTLAEAKTEELMNLSYSHVGLSDADGDGTNKDNNDDGVDDDGNNFGLDDITTADGSEANGRYTVYWNVAVDEPVTGSKTIRVIVTWTEKGKDKRIALDFVKTNLS